MTRGVAIACGLPVIIIVKLLVFFLIENWRSLHIKMGGKDDSLKPEHELSLILLCSDVSISEQSEVKSSARSVTKVIYFECMKTIVIVNFTQLEETEDLTLSQSSLGDFDYAESAKT